MSAPPAMRADEALARLAPGGAGAVVPEAWDVIWVEGPEAERFLQGVLSNDVAALGAGSSLEALLLDAKGHLRHAALVHRDGPEAFTLLAPEGEGPDLVAELERLHVAEDLEIFADVAELAVTNAPGDAGADLEVALRPGLRGLLGPGARAVAARLGVPLAEHEALEATRVAAGVLLPRADAVGGGLVQELGLDDVAVSFAKGCYLGQETVARVAHRGKVNRRLAGLLLGAPARAGAPVSGDGREVGRVAASARHPALGPIALAVLRSEVPVGAPVAVEGSAAPARVVALPFARSATEAA